MVKGLVVTCYLSGEALGQKLAYLIIVKPR